MAQSVQGWIPTYQGPHSLVPSGHAWSLQEEPQDLRGMRGTWSVEYPVPPLTEEGRPGGTFRTFLGWVSVGSKSRKRPLS
jgi:hypothetical protein